ncbi:unnamed protein product [Symbiodinium sp. CCMP2592]|nr:unnamed protein product [Symbiodinium sp. CCMP2592]
MSTKVLNEFMRSMAPGACYTTLALFRDLETRVHSDHGNDPSLMNTILKVSEFSHGGLWVETVGGKVPCPLPHQGQRMGNVVEFANGALSFDAQQPHCVMPWSRGPRVVLVAFSVRNWANLRRADLTELSNLGFKLPTLGPDSTAGPESASSVLPSPGVFPFPPPAPTPALAASPVTLPPHASVPGTAPAAADHPDLGGSNVARDVTATAQPSFIELFCGSAGLSAEVRKLGFRVLGVDHKPTAKHANAPFVSLDLRDPEQQDRIWVELRRAQAVWIAPPCGTASIARQIPLGRSAKGPAPLRSPAFPDGLASLRPEDHARVQSANRLYAFAAKVWTFCLEHDILCIVENPASSLMWQTSWFRTLVPRGVWHELHSCMYGSARKKRTALLATCRLPGLMLQCDKSHEHKKWGRVRDPDGRGVHYATAEETAYPAGLCTAAAREICLALQNKGIMLDVRASSDTALASSFAQRQPRRGRGIVGPPEYKRTVLVRLPRDFQPPDHVPDEPLAVLRDVPAGSKLLWTRVFVDGGVEVREAQFGVYHTPDEFLNAALKVTHPFDSAVSIDGPNLRAIAFTLEHGVKAVQQRRMEVLEHYRALEHSLRSDEEALKQAMDPTVREIMGNKKLLLFKQMLKDAGVPDERLFEDMVQGFRLTGPLVPSGLFPPKYKPAVISVDELRRTSQWSKHLVEAACRKASQDPEIARAVWEESLGQVEKGWLSGPFTWDQMDQKYGGTWVASKRFGVSQGDKVRAVDDLSQFQVNASVTETEKIQLEGLDDIVALARFHLGATVSGTKVFRLPLSGGGVYQGRLHPDFREGRARRLKGRALDLRSAYKQLARHPADDWASVLGVLDPDTNTVAYFESHALPFGASGAVTGFNRAAGALRIIMSRLLFLVNTSFFDDFCQLEIDGLTDSADQAALALLDLLGWEVSDGEKLKPFASEFTMLGAVLSFKVATQLIHHAERQPGPDVHGFVLQSLKREKGNQVTHGAVIVDPASQTREVFGGHIPEDLVTKWRSSGRTQLIFFAELYPVLIARRTWAKVLRNRRVLIFVDNEAAKAALIRNYSPLLDAAHMLSDIAELDVELSCFPWYCRVPSKSNFSDAASRLSFGEYEECFRRIQPTLAAF